MAGTVRAAKLESPTSRTRLRRGRKCHWRTIAPGRTHLGWRRWAGKRGEAGGTWFLRRYIGIFKSKNGKDVAKYRTETLGLADDVRPANGETVLDFNQAQANANARLNSPKRGSANLTVREAMENYKRFKKSEGQPTDDLESRGNAHILPALGDLVVAELTSDQIRNWLSTLASQPAMVRSKRGKPQRYKPESDGDEAVRRRRSSANRVLTILKAALNHAFDEGHVSTNKAWGRRVKPFRNVEVARVRYLSVAEAKRLINASDPNFRRLVQAALQTGARYGELIRLEVADFNRDAGTVAIRQSKSGKPRHVVLTEEGVSFFRQVTHGRPGTEPIFKRADGTAWEKSHQGRPMAEAVQRAKIEPPIGFHGLRHTWASLSVMNGMPLLIVAGNLGHLTKDGQPHTRMAERHYAHLGPSYVAEAIREKAPKFGFKAENPRVVPLERTKRGRGGG